MQTPGPRAAGPQSFVMSSHPLPQASRKNTNLRIPFRLLIQTCKIKRLRLLGCCLGGQLFLSMATGSWCSTQSPALLQRANVG